MNVDIGFELTYSGYAHNRRIAPHITAERWAKVWPNAAELEARYQRELAAGAAPGPLNVQPKDLDRGA